MAEADGQAVVRLGLAGELDPALAGGPAAAAVGAGFARAVVLPRVGQIGLEVTAHINGDRFRAPLLVTMIPAATKAVMAMLAVVLKNLFFMTIRSPSPKPPRT